MSGQHLDFTFSLFVKLAIHKKIKKAQSKRKHEEGDGIFL